VESVPLMAQAVMFMLSPLRDIVAAATHISDLQMQQPVRDAHQ
jgi:hypothetical protein